MIRPVPTLIPPLDPARDHLRGPANAPVTLAEFGDYQCPYCGEAEPVVRELLDRYAGRLGLMFRHMPQPGLHPRSPAAAEAAEAAGAQGRFWDMHDRLYEHQRELGDDDLRAHAAAIGLDVERFDRELRERVHVTRVEEDLQSGMRSGVPSTPRFFVNGVIHLGSATEAELSAAIEAAA